MAVKSMPKLSRARLLTLVMLLCIHSICRGEDSGDSDLHILHAEGKERRSSEQQLAASEVTALPEQHTGTASGDAPLPVDSIPVKIAEAGSLSPQAMDTAILEAAQSPDHGADLPPHAGQAAVGESGLAAAVGPTQQEVGESGLAAAAPAQQEESQRLLHAATPAKNSEAVRMALGDYSKEGVEKRLQAAQRVMFGSWTKRNIRAGVLRMLELSAIVDRSLPGARPRTLYAPAVPAGTETPSPAPAPAADKSDLLSKSGTYVGTGVDAAAHAVFSLAAFQAHGLLTAEGLPRSQAAAIIRLHNAASAGSSPALYALADRFAHGYDVPKDEALALKFAKLAADRLVADIERSQSVGTAPLAPMDLRDRWMDRQYISGEDAENSEQVIAMEEDLALRGNVAAQRRVAYRRLVGRGMEADPAGAYQDFAVAAQQGDPHAVFNLGYMHLRGLHVPVNHTVAMRYFEQAAKMNVSAAWGAIGTMHWIGQGAEQNHTAAFEALNRGAALNNSDCFLNLGTMLAHGIGTERNLTKAFQHFARADELGHWKASFSLGNCYQEGHGTERNATKALELYKRLFRERAMWTEAISNATKAYDDGDEWGALAQFVLAAEQGSEAAAANAAWMLRRGPAGAGAGFPVGPAARLELAARLYERAAAQGRCAACAVELGNLVHDAEVLGLSRPRNLTEMLYWYRVAADANSTEGIYLLGWAHQRGVGTARNLTVARGLYARAVQSAGKVHRARAVAPMLGLVALRLDVLLLPVFGDDATQRMLGFLRRKLHLGPPLDFTALSLHGQGEAPPGETGRSGEGNGNPVASGQQASLTASGGHQGSLATPGGRYTDGAAIAAAVLQSLGAAWTAGGEALSVLHYPNVEDAALVILLLALAAVLCVMHLQLHTRRVDH